jgi:dipeptidase E
MRMYLSSFDLGERPETLVALVGSAGRAGIVVNALDHLPSVRALWLKKQTDKLVGLGFSLAELDLRDYFGASDTLGARLNDMDAVWITGGNAFNLRRAMKQSGFDALIKNALARDEIVYAGFSAAAVIASDSLRGLEIVDNPQEVPPGYDPKIIWDGLGLLPFAIAVHFKSDHRESHLVDREIAFYETNGISYRTLRDGEALVVDGERWDVVGKYVPPIFPLHG